MYWMCDTVSPSTTQLLLLAKRLRIISIYVLWWIWLTLTNSQTSIRVLPPSLVLQVEEKTVWRRQEDSWIRINFISKNCVQKQNKTRTFSTSHQQADVPLTGRQGHNIDIIYLYIFGSTNTITINVFSSSFPELLLLSLMSCSMEHPFDQFESVTLETLSPNLQSDLSLLAKKSGGGGRPEL